MGGMRITLGEVSLIASFSLRVTQCDPCDLLRSDPVKNFLSHPNEVDDTLQRRLQQVVAVIAGDRPWRRQQAGRR